MNEAYDEGSSEDEKTITPSEVINFQMLSTTKEQVVRGQAAEQESLSEKQATKVN